jgi:O-antigen ligase
MTISTLLGVINGSLNLLKSSFYLLKYIEYFMLYFMVTNCIKSQRQIKVFLFFILITSLIVSIYALSTVGDYGRATAPFEDIQDKGGEPNTLGGYLLLIFAVIAGLLLYTKSILSGLPLGMLAVFVVVTLLQTLSRGSYIGFVMMFLALTILSRKKKLIPIILVFLFIFTGWSHLPKKVTERINETFIPGRIFEPLKGTRVTLDESASARVESWKTVFKKWQRSPILGYGVTGLGFVDTQLPLVLGEGGIVGLAVFIWLIITVFRNSLWIFKNIEGDYFRGLTLGYIAGFVGLLLHSFSAATFIIVRIMEPFWFLTAIVIMLPEIQKGTNNQSEVGALQIAPAG